MIEGSRFFENKKYKLLAWLVILVVVIVAEYMYKNAAWTCDAYDYWTRGELLKEGKFYLGSIDGFRGYVYPLFLGVINWIGGKTAWYVINGIFVATFITCILPKINIEKDFNKASFLKVISAGMLLVIFFVGLFVYPLSDLFATINIFMAIICMKNALEEVRFAKLIHLFLMGVFCYWAYNTRVIYMFADFSLVFIFIIISCVKRKKTGKSIIILLGEVIVCVVGCFIAAIPQIIMNLINLGKFYVGVPTNGLMLNQMFWGIRYQRYDTYIATTIDEIHLSPQVFFIDPSGVEVLNKMQLTGFNYWEDFFRVFFSHPIDIILIYIRHLVNFIFPCWPQIYVGNLNSSKWVLGLLGATFVFFTFYVFLEKCILNYMSIIYYIPLLMPAILIIPGAVEYRFSLPFYIFAICQLCFNVDYNKLNKSIINQKWKVFFIYLVFVAFCFTIWSNMLVNESVTPLLF